MLYKFNKSNLIHEKISFKSYLKVLCFISAIFTSSLYVSYYNGRMRALEGMSDVERIIEIKEHDVFHQDKLVEMMKSLNVKYPWIPMAQSIVETGHWKSHIFKENHNLFGMKEAKQRVTTAQGTQNNHAYYSTWRESVYDYAFYQARYLGQINSESDYYAYLDASYAENPNYIAAIKKAIEEYKLKELFL
jgi:uncharacterized FlgJ-related protein